MEQNDFLPFIYFFLQGIRNKVPFVLLNLNRDQVKNFSLK
jgi:hypothetical protein